MGVLPPTPFIHPQYPKHTGSRYILKAYAQGKSSSKSIGYILKTPSAFCICHEVTLFNTSCGASCVSRVVPYCATQCFCAIAWHASSCMVDYVLGFVLMTSSIVCPIVHSMPGANQHSAPLKDAWCRRKVARDKVRGALRPLGSHGAGGWQSRKHML